MTRDDIIKYFNTNFTSLKKMIIEIAFWAYEPDENLCKPLAEGLLCLAKDGNIKAIVLYAVIAAYGNNADCFSKATALQMLFTNNAIDEYVAFVDDEFKEDVDADLYDYLYSFPAVSLFEQIVSENEV